MKAKINMTAGAEYTHDKYNDTLRSLRGQWVEIDTQYLFHDQYNLKDYDVRIFDKDIDAVQDDPRAGMVKCGYCGKQFANADELTAHYDAEEAAAHDCENCRDYISGIAEVKHDTTTETDADGNKIETRTTKYIYGKKCRWAGCNKLEHRNHKPDYFTPKNTYFLKYPNGYSAYFMELPIAGQWKELGYKWDDAAKTATKTGAVGTYDAVLSYSDDGKLNALFLSNSRASYVIERDEINRILNGTFAIDYMLRWDDNGHEKKNPLEGFPKSCDRAKYGYFEGVRDAIRYAPYKRQLILGY